MIVGDTSPLLCDVAAQIGRKLPGKLKHKELFEGFSMARLVQKHTWHQRRLCLDVIDMCAGSGIVGIFLALMHARRKVLALDRRQSVLAAQLHEHIGAHFPGLQERLHWKTEDLRPVGGSASMNLPKAVVVACHACGLLSDEVIATATANLRPLVLLPCCYRHNPKVGVAFTDITMFCSIFCFGNGVL